MRMEFLRMKSQVAIGVTSFFQLQLKVITNF